MLRYKDLIILAERVFFTEEVLVKGHTGFGHVEHFLYVDVRDKSFPCVESHQGESLLLPFVEVERPGNDRVQVSRDLERLAEVDLNLVSWFSVGLVLEQSDGAA